MKLLCITALAVLLATPFAPAQADWQGSEGVRDGVTYVTNPETALETVRIPLELEWSRGDEDDDIIFGLPSRILEDDAGNVYILDSQLSEILVFSGSGEYLRTIGREGEGPGEFRDSNDMYIRPDGVLGIVRVFPGKVVQMTTDGLPTDDFRLPVEEGEGFQLVFRGIATGDRVVLCGARQSMNNNQQVQINYLKAFDKDGKELAHYYETSEHTQYGGMKFQERIFTDFKGRWTLSPDGHVAAVLGYDDYQIHVWNPDGTLKHVIERPDYKRLARSGDEKKRFQKLYDGLTSWSPNSTFTIEEAHRTVSQVWYRPDGSLWALNSRGSWARDEGVFISFDVYNESGHFVRRVDMLGEGDPSDDGVFFAGNHFYRVVNRFGALMARFGDEEAEDEEMDPLQVVAYPLDVPEMGMNR